MNIKPGTYEDGPLDMPFTIRLAQIRAWLKRTWNEEAGTTNGRNGRPRELSEPEQAAKEKGQEALGQHGRRAMLSVGAGSDEEAWLLLLASLDVCKMPGEEKEPWQQ